MDSDDIRTDLDQTLHQVTRLTAPPDEPDSTTLAHAASLLEGFASRHRAALSFENFPLPAGSGDVLCSYELHDDAQTGLTLWLQAIRGGVDSGVHDHGTWAVIVAIAGQERNRIYRRTDDGSSAYRATLELQCEVAVCEGQPLVLQQGLFHSIHTDPGKPALQLHLYGRNPDTVEGRSIVDLQDGRLLYLDARG
nr:cysteine dioxygenase [Pseudomonas sp.]